MATRTNLVPNPALGVDATGWHGESGAARVTGLSDLPRATGFSGPAGATVTPQVVVVEGETYTLSVYVRPQAGGTIDYGVDWLQDGVGYLSSTAVQHQVVSSGGVYRLVVTGVVPTDADRALIALTFPDGTLVATAYLAEHADAPAEDYFDGDSTGEQPSWVAAWTGTAGLSTSTLTYDEDPPPPPEGVRENHATNPALKISAADWWGGPGAARVTGLTGLPRATGYSNPAGSPAVTPQAEVVAGEPATLSVWVKPAASGTIDYGIDWRSSTTGYLSSTPVGHRMVTADSVYRLEVSGTAPVGADRALLSLVFPAGTLVMTGYLAEQASGPAGDFFDGDSTGEQQGWSADWDGADGLSTSTLTFSALGGVTEFAPLDIRAVGRVRSVGYGFTTFAPLAIFTGLIVTATYDDRRGRVRVYGSGLPAETVRVVVSHRVAGTSRWAEVRGGRVAITSGQEFARFVDDYEYTAGVTMQYRVVALATPEQAADVVVQTKIITADLGGVRDAWLKFVASPQRNVRVQLVGWDEVEREARLDLHQVRGRRDPIAVTDVHSSRRVTIHLRTITVADGDALDEALSAGFPALLHLPATTVALPSMYCVIGSYSYRRPAQRSVVRRWVVPITEISAPPPSVVGVGRTWQTVVDSYSSWAELLDEASTWLEVLD